MPNADTAVRPARSDDATAVAEIFSHYVANTLITFEETAPTAEEWRQRIDDARERHLPFKVAEVDGRVVGYAYAGPWRPKPAYRHTVEDTIYLARDWTGKGIGRGLLSALLDDCGEAEVRQVIAVIADTGDLASIALHRAFCFTDVGRLKAVGYKREHWVDTLLMQRDLTSDAV
jgi:L-amino acid N-acyltransferase YncA